MNKKKNYITIAVAALVLTIGVTFAYFIAQTGVGANANLNLTADTVDDLKFSVSKDNLSLNINQFNFASGSGNISDVITATASLKANSTKNTATSNYYVYFQIESNDYIYTTTDKKPEIVLSITGPNGEITSVDGLTYVSATNADGTIVKGFDITQVGSSLIKIVENQEITSTSSTNYTNQDWTFTATFINLNTNQVNNESRNLTGKVLIQKEKIIDSIADVAKNGDSLTTVIETLGLKENSQTIGLYHHDSNLANGAEDDSYRFTGANPNNYVCFGSDEETCPHENLFRIIGLIDGKIKLISADGATSDMLGTDGNYLGIVSNSYYPATYINYFYKQNGDLTKIGLYDRSYELWYCQTYETNLNKNFLTYLDGKNAKWQEMIDNTRWFFGSITLEQGIYTNAKMAYDYELGKKKNQPNPQSLVITRTSQKLQNEDEEDLDYSRTDSKIGLMYLHDYYYASSQKYWTLPGFDENGEESDDSFSWAGEDYSRARNDNWMYIGLPEMTISRTSDYSNRFLGISFDGIPYWSSSGMFVVRPTFNLISSIKYVSGSGTSSDPIRISL